MPPFFLFLGAMAEVGRGEEARRRSSVDGARKVAREGSGGRQILPGERWSGDARGERGVSNRRHEIERETSLEFLSAVSKRCNLIDRPRVPRPSLIKAVS